MKKEISFSILIIGAVMILSSFCFLFTHQAIITVILSALGLFLLKLSKKIK